MMLNVIELVLCMSLFPSGRQALDSAVQAKAKAKPASRNPGGDESLCIGCESFSGGESLNGNESL